MYGVVLLPVISLYSRIFRKERIPVSFRFLNKMVMNIRIKNTAAAGEGVI